jgi:vancomycin resistance protein YoaR
LTAREPDLTEDEARKLGVNAPIASFTTRHPGGQPRVQNIHHIADLLRGTLIQPGRTFSVNDTVGRRTAAKGFVSAPVIEDGRFSESIGGGISQFATTLFNAAFEAGLDFGEYQSHSIYISRYPYGREATLSYPAPDLEIENNSPYGVLIWPTYTDTSITVTLYSTKFAEVRQSGQTRSPRGACTRVRTERTRTFLADGRSDVDEVFATYRPAEGVNC